jgi:hypothetical protein
VRLDLKHKLLLVILIDFIHITKYFAGPKYNVKFVCIEIHWTQHINAVTVNDKIDLMIRIHTIMH